MKIFETIVGFIVLMLVFYIMVMFYHKSNVSYDDHYVLYVNFNNVNGLKIGNEVRVSGVKVGYVADRDLESSYNVKVHLLIKNGILLPTDTSAEIVTEGFMGDKYIKLTPGSEQKKLKNGENIEYSSSYDLNIESIINKFIVKDVQK